MQKQRFRIVVIFILLLSGLAGFTVSFYLHTRLTNQPSVTVIQTFHYPATFVKQLAGDPEAGKKIFYEFCAACHAKEPTIDINAPSIGDKKIWQALQQLGIENLLKITIHGQGAMPARGGCFECSDQQLRETIQYILKQS